MRPAAHRRSGPTRASPPAALSVAPGRTGAARTSARVAVRALAGRRRRSTGTSPATTSPWPTASCAPTSEPPRSGRGGGRRPAASLPARPCPTRSRPAAVPWARARPGSTCPTRCSAARASSPTCGPPGCCSAAVAAPPSAGATLASSASRTGPGVDAGARRLLPRRGRRATRPTSTGRSSSCAGLPPGTSATCCPTRTTCRRCLRAGPHEDIAVARRGAGAPGPDATSSRRRTRRPFLAHASIAPSCGVARWEPTTRVHVLEPQPGHPPAARRDRRRARPRPGARSWSSTSRTPAATGTTPPTTRRSTRCCWPAPCPAGRCCCAGPGPTSSTWGPLAPAMTATVRGAARRRADRRLVLRRVEPGAHARGPGYAGAPGLLAGGHLADAAARSRRRPTRRRPPAAAPPATPLPAVRRRAAARRRPPHDRDPAAHLGDAGARRLHLNVFAIESFMDELAEAAGADPVAFRLAPPRPTRGPRHVRRPRPPGSPAGARPLPEDTGRGLGLRALQGPRRLLRGRRRGRGRPTRCAYAG